MSKLSIVIPVYFNEMNLIDLYDDLELKVLKNLPKYEIIMVDDGSSDDSFKIMQELSDKDDNIKIYRLSRNFGSHAAILAGIHYATGDCITSKAADLQEPSELIMEMYEKWERGANVVLAVREDREEPYLQKMLSNTYYKIMRKFALKNMPEGGFDCFLIDKKVAKVLDNMEESNTSLMGQILWCGFRSEVVYYTRRARLKGKSKWTLSKKVKLSVDSILGFSYLPIRAVTFIGIVTFIGAIIWMIYVLIYKLTRGISTEGWTTIIIINLFFYGLIMLSLGIIGEYLWRTFDAARNRPVYIVESENDESEEKHEGNNSSRR